MIFMIMNIITIVDLLNEIWHDLRPIYCVLVMFTSARSAHE